MGIDDSLRNVMNHRDMSGAVMMGGGGGPQHPSMMPLMSLPGLGGPGKS